MDIFVHSHADRGIMLKDDELKEIYGGGITTSYITALVRGVNAILDVGRSLGTIIRRIQSGKLC